MRGRLHWKHNMLNKHNRIKWTSVFWSPNVIGWPAPLHWSHFTKLQGKDTTHLWEGGVHKQTPWYMWRGPTNPNKATIRNLWCQQGMYKLLIQTVGRFLLSTYGCVNQPLAYVKLGLCTLSTRRGDGKKKTPTWNLGHFFLLFLMDRSPRGGGAPLKRF